MPIFGQGTAAKLADARKRLEERQASLATSRKILDGIDAELDSVAMRTHAGKLDEQQADRALAEVTERERVHTAAVDHLERTVALIEDEIGELEHGAALAAHGEAVELVKSAQATVLAASTIVAKQAAQLRASAGKVEAAREALAAAVAAADELYIDGAGDLPIADEPDWLDAAELDELIETLRAGPVQPTVTEATNSATATAERERRDRELIEPVAIRALSGGGSRLDIERLPEQLQPRAHARIAQLRELRRAEQRGQAQQTEVESGHFSRVAV